MIGSLCAVGVSRRIWIGIMVDFRVRDWEELSISGLNALKMFWVKGRTIVGWSSLSNRYARRPETRKSFKVTKARVLTQFRNNDSPCRAYVFFILFSYPGWMANKDCKSVVYFLWRCSALRLRIWKQVGCGGGGNGVVLCKRDYLDQAEIYHSWVASYLTALLVRQSWPTVVCVTK